MFAEKTESIPPKLRNKTRVSTFTIIQHSFGSPSYSNHRRKRKEIQMGKEEVKLSLSADDILYKIISENY